jgi:hypothetical protein
MALRSVFVHAGSGRRTRERLVPTVQAVAPRALAAWTEANGTKSGVERGGAG